jgi:hypothetical protein
MAYAKPKAEDLKEIVRIGISMNLVKNGNTLCDVLLGPCSCGAFHSEDEVKVRAMRVSEVITTIDLSLKGVKL